MQSPFSVFRKNQKVLMVVLVGLAMFSFIVLGTLEYVTDIPPWIWVVVLAAVGAGVAWIVGAQTTEGKEKEYTVSGLLIGLALGIALLMFSRKAPAVETTVGNLSEKDLRTMIINRQKATSFMRDCYISSVEMPPKPRLPWNMVQQFGNNEWARPYRLEHERLAIWQRGMINAAFGFSEQTPITEEDIIDKYLLLQEAKELGIEVTDEAVVAYIHRMAKGITTQAYLRARKDTGLSEPELFDILREEIAIQQVYRLRAPQQFVLPEDYWRRYRQINVTEDLEIVAVPTALFIDDVPEPTDKQIKEFFEKYKDKQPSNTPSPDPAFGLPDRVQISYFQANLEEVEKDVLKQLANDFLTDEEIKDALKEIDDGIADVEKRIADKTIKEELAEKERINAKQEYLRKLLTSGEKVNRLEFEVVQNYEQQKNTSYLNSEWSPPFPEGKDPAKKDPFLKTDGPTEAIKPNVAPPAPTGKTSGLFRLNQLRTLGMLFATPTLSVALLQPANAGKTDAGKKQPPIKSAPKTKSLSQQAPPPPLPEDPPAPPAAPYQPLTAELKATIQKTILPKHVLREVRVRLQKAAAEMERLATKRLNSLEDDGEEFSPVDIAKELRSKADEWGLEFVTTEPFSELEFIRSSEYPMNNAVQIFSMADNAVPRQDASPINQVLFQRNSDGKPDARNKQLYRVIRAVTGDRTGITNVFVLWKTTHLDAQVPALTDDGIREKVVAAWKEFQARDLAKKRAEELKSLVSEAKKPMADALIDVTVTGKPDTLKLSPQRTSRPISWLSRQRPSNPSLGMNPREMPLSPTQIPGTEKVGLDFRSTVFENLKDAELGVAPNIDHSVYYVVRVLNRTPTTPPGREEQMRQLLQEKPMTDVASYGDIASEANMKRQLLQQKFFQELREKYQVKRRSRNGDNP